MLEMLELVEQIYPDLYIEIRDENIDRDSALQWVQNYGDGDEIDQKCIDEITTYFNALYEKLTIESLVCVDIYIDNGERHAHDISIYVRPYRLQFLLTNIIANVERYHSSKTLIFVDGVLHNE